MLKKQFIKDWCAQSQEELEKVQNRAARFVSKNNTFKEGSMTDILEQLVGISQEKEDG